MSKCGFDYPDYNPSTGAGILTIVLAAGGNIDGMDSTGMSAGQVVVVIFSVACVVVNQATVVSPILPWDLGDIGPDPNLELTPGSAGLFEFYAGTWKSIAPIVVARPAS